MFDRLKSTAHRLRTVAGAGVVAALGVLNVAGTLDLTPLISMFTSDEQKIGATMVVLAILFGMIHYFGQTDDSQFAPSPSSRGVDEGN